MQSNAKRLLGLAFNTAAAVIIVIDGVARPLYRPILQWVASIEVISRAEEQIARLPRPAILALFAVPFAIAEPAKVLALVWLAEGSLFSGLLLLAVSYLATFLVVERIYHAGKTKLLTYAWFAWCIDQLSVIRDRLNDAKAHVKGFVSRILG